MEDSRSDPEPRLSGGPSLRRLLPALALGALVLLFLAEPILRYPSAYYCFADFVQSFSLVNVEPGHFPSNRAMGDPAVIYLPWTILNRRAVQAGHLPLWNPYNGGGVPHLANYQSGVFSPYNLPFYVLGLRAALLVSAFLKLFAIAAFTYLFLRRCDLGRTASLLGAAAFTFSGYHIVWVSGAITATSASLPASLYFAETALRRAQDAKRTGTTARLAPALAGLTLSLTVGLLAGHPENLYFGGLLITAYLAFRLWQMRRDLGLARAATLGARFVACTAIALLLAAVQLVPFFEYLLHSAVITGRSSLSAGLMSRPVELLPLLLAPRILGDFGTTYRFLLHGTSYAEAIGPYSGAAVLLLCLLSIRLLRWSAHVRFFLVTAALWLVYAFNPLGVAMAFRAIPGLGELPVIRSFDIWLFSVCCAAAWLLDALIERRPERPGWIAILSTGLGILAGGLLAGHWLLAIYRPRFEAAGPASRTMLHGNLVFFAWTFVIGLAAVLLTATARRVTVRQAGGALLIAVAFLQTGFLLRHFNPTIEDRLVYPVTREMKTLQRLVGRSYLLEAGGRSRSLVADTNIVYGLALPNSYDGIWIRRYDRLYRKLFGQGSFPRTPLHFDSLGLQLFGIDYVLTDGPLVNTALEDRKGLDRQPRPLPPLGRSGAIQTFLSTAENLGAVSVVASCKGDLDAGGLDLKLVEAVSRALVAHRTVPCSDIGKVPRAVPLVFPAVPDSERRRYRLELSAVGASDQVQIVPYTWSGFNYSAGMLAVAGKRHWGTLAFDFAYDLDLFEPVAPLRDRRLYRFHGGRSRFYTVGRAVEAQDDGEAWSDLELPEFDPRREVVLTGPVSSDEPIPDNDDPGEVKIQSEEDTRLDLAVRRSEPGYLVLAKPHYPGWRATVNGVSRPLLRANYAFMAVRVPAGPSRVTVWYEPASLRWGALASLGTLLLAGVWLGWQVRRRPRRSRPERGERLRGAAAAASRTPPDPASPR